MEKLEELEAARKAAMAEYAKFIKWADECLNHGDSEMEINYLDKAEDAFQKAESISHAITDLEYDIAKAVR